MKYIYPILIVVLGCAITVICASAYAKDLAALHSVMPGEMFKADDYNVVVVHTQELERKVAGMQKCITELYSKINKLEKR